MASVTLILNRTKATSGTVVFGSADPKVAITSLYVKKGHGFEDAEAIKITIETSPVKA